MNSNDKISIKSGIDSTYEALYAKTCQRIEAATQFILNMSSVDKSAVVLFTSSASTVQSMTNSKEDLKLSLQSITSSGGTSFYDALIESYNAFEENIIGANCTNNRIILLSDGEDGEYDNTIRLLSSIYDENSSDNRKSIKIYTIGLGTSYDSRLEEIATISHGEFFKAYTANDLVDIYTEIGTGGDFDTTDTDGDGLYDAVETAGIRIQNGQIFRNDYDNDILFTNPTKRDTDEDGLSDGEEIDPTIRWRSGGGNSGTKEYFFFMKSDPHDEDTDGDGLLDGKPRFYDGKPLAPVDPNPSTYTGNRNLWNMHIEEIMSGSNTATGYSNDYYDVIEPEISLEFTDTFIPIPYFDNNMIEVLFSSVSTLGSVALDFRYDDQYIALHSDTTQWQAIGGYNDFYDWVFDVATSMNRMKLDFEENNKNYVIWAWKGNYLTLVAGSEVGFYTQNSTLESVEKFTGLEQWMVEIELPMTLSLYNVNSSGLVIDSYYHWLPDEEQWWITGFVPDIYDPDINEDELIQIASVDFSSNPQLLADLRNKWKNRDESQYLIFDMRYSILWLMW